MKQTVISLNKGDMIRIDLADGFRVAGRVISADNYKDQQGNPNWYIELEGVAGDLTGYTYWKQRQDGGYIHTVYQPDEVPCQDCLWPIKPGDSDRTYCTQCARLRRTL